MKKFIPPQVATLSGVIAWLQEFAPRVGREIRRVEGKIPEPGPTMEQILEAVRDSAEVKDAFYRYIRDRQKKEEA